MKMGGPTRLLYYHQVTRSSALHAQAEPLGVPAGSTSILISQIQGAKAQYFVTKSRRASVIFLGGGLCPFKPPPRCSRVIRFSSLWVHTSRCRRSGRLLSACSTGWQIPGHAPGPWCSPVAGSSYHTLSPTHTHAKERGRAPCWAWDHAGVT